jgi:hypothetical protein
VIVCPPAADDHDLLIEAPGGQAVRPQLASIRPEIASLLGCDAELADARVLLDDGGEATRQRAVCAERGVRGLTAWLAERFVASDEPLLSEHGFISTDGGHDRCDPAAGSRRGCWRRVPAEAASVIVVDRPSNAGARA